MHYAISTAEWEERFLLILEISNQESVAVKIDLIISQNRPEDMLENSRRGRNYYTDDVNERQFWHNFSVFAESSQCLSGGL